VQELSELLCLVHADDVTPPYGADVPEPPADHHVYLTTDVIIDYWAAMDEHWDPADDMAHRSNQRRIAAARLVFYGYRGRTPPGSPAPWYLVTSSKTRKEIASRSGSDLITGFIAEVDLASDASDATSVVAKATQIAEIAGVTDSDALDLAYALLRPWVRYVVTNDDAFRALALKLDIAPLRLISVFEAVEMLSIRPRETPPVSMIGRPWRPWLIPG
jgi:hypothetical protein